MGPTNPVRTEERRRLAEAVAAGWNQAAVGYAVVNGVEPRAAGLGRDLDVCVDRHELRRALALALAAFRAEGYRCRAHATTWGHHYLFAARPDTPQVMLEIDLFPDLRWGPALLVRRPQTDFSEGPFQLDSWACFVKRVLLQLLADNRAKLRARPDRVRLRQHERKPVTAGLQRWLGEALAARLVSASTAADVEGLIALSAACRRALLRRSWRQGPGALAGTAVSWLRSEIGHAFPKRCAPIVACCGPDAERVTTTAAALGDALAECLALPGVRVRRLRPGWLGGPPAFAGGPPGWRLIRYVTDFAVGGRLRDRRDSATLKIVVYERCALDLHDEPQRFGLARGAGSLLPWRVSEKPDVVIRIGGKPVHSLGAKSLLLQLPADTPSEAAVQQALPVIVTRFLEADRGAAC